MVVVFTKITSLYIPLMSECHQSLTVGRHGVGTTSISLENKWHLLEWLNAVTISFFNKDYLEQLSTFHVKESMTNASGKGHTLAPATLSPINKQICVKNHHFPRDDANAQLASPSQ